MVSIRRRYAFAVCVLAASACGAPSVGNSDTAPQLDLWEQPIADAPDPAERGGAASGFVECEHGIGNAGWSADAGPSPSGQDAESALESFVDQGLFGLPRSGYELAGVDEGRALFTYAVDGSPKVAVIVQGEPWQFETFASCDPAEFDPAGDDERDQKVWTDTDGHRVPTSIVTSFAGSEHCGWQSVTYLIYQDRQYISDPSGVMGVPFVVPFDDDAELPPDAVDTAYSHDGATLWLSSDGDVAYLVSEDRVEAWPTPDWPDSVWCA